MPFLARIFILSSLILNIFCVQILFAQESSGTSGNVYDSDPLLYNGKKYTFFIPANTGGHQFFSDQQFVTGSVIIRSVKYTGLFLNYDIFNQKLVLQYVDGLGARNQIEMSDAWLESFTIQEKYFEIIRTGDSLKHIFQVIGSGHYCILYRWEKDLVLDGFIGATNHAFTLPRREMILFTDNQLYRYTNNKTFYSLFVPYQKKKIIEYLRNNRINVKKSTDSTMSNLVNYINTLPSQ